MAGIFTAYTANKLKKLVQGAEAFTLPSTLHIAAYTGSDGIRENNASQEASYVGYERKVITFDGTGVNSPVFFDGPPTEVTITHIGILDADADKILWAAPLTNPAVLTPGKPLFFDSGDIVINIDTI